jgi:hypothetical protein
MLEQSRASISATHAMVAASRYRIAAARRHLNPWFAFTGGSDVDDLRAMVRARIATGGLFPVQGPRAWASQGEDRPCGVCQELITRAQVEYEVSDAVADTRVRAHLRCYMVWREESQAPAGPRRHAEGALDTGLDPGLA